RGRDDDTFVRAFDWVTYVPEVAIHLDLLNFEVRNCGEQLGVPVHKTLVFINESSAIKLHKNFKNRAREPLVHGETLATPVAGRAEPFQLIDNGAAGFGFPLPH